MADQEETPKVAPKFDFSAYPPNTLFHERRYGTERRGSDEVAAENFVIRPTEAEAEAEPGHPDRRARKERRRRIDPTTFEKQYSDEELEFMNAMQKYKVQTGKTFPTHGEVLRVATELGYRRTVLEVEHPAGEGYLDPDKDL